jgi:hypothetical protein
MSGQGHPAAIDERLRQELGDSLMAVEIFAQVIDRATPGNSEVHDAVSHIQDAVTRSREAVEDLSRELGEVARRLSSRAVLQ